MDFGLRVGLEDGHIANIYGIRYELYERSWSTAVLTATAIPGCGETVYRRFLHF